MTTRSPPNGHASSILPLSCDAGRGGRSVARPELAPLPLARGAGVRKDAMKITSSRPRSGAAATVARSGRPGRRAPAARTAQTTVFLIHTDEGLTGLGAGVGQPGVRAAEQHRAAAGRPGPVPVRAPHRHDPQQRRPLAGPPARLGHRDGALGPVRARPAGQPLWKLWGGYTDRIKAYASMIELRAPEQRAEDALHYLELGYRAIKLRIHAWTMKEDVAQVEAVRKAVGDTHGDHGRRQPGPDARARRATEAARSGPSSGRSRPAASWSELDVRWLEEPLARYAFDDLAALTARHQRAHRRRREQRRAARVPHR